MSEASNLYKIHKIQPLSKPLKLVPKDKKKPDGSGIPYDVELKLQDSDIIVQTYIIHNDWGDEYEFVGKYNTYDLEKYNILLSGKKLIKYYKCTLQEVADSGSGSYGGGNSHVFVFEDQKVDVVYLPYRFDCEIYRESKNDAYNVQVGMLEFKELIEVAEKDDMEYEIIGFTEDKIIYAFETEDDVMDSLKIENSRNYMSNYATLTENSEIYLLEKK